MTLNTISLRSVCALLCAALAGACADASSTDDGAQKSGASEQENAPGCAEIELDAPDDGTQVSMAMTVPAHEEREYCRLVMLDHDLNLSYSEGYYTEGSHHGTVYATGYHGELPTMTVDGKTFEGDPGQPHPCPTGPGTLWDVRGTIGGARSVRLQGTPNRTVTGGGSVLPPNVAVRLKAGDVVVVNFHMANTGEEDLDACIKLSMHGVPDEEVTQEAGAFFLYNVHITIPPARKASARMACPVLEDVTLLDAVSHMHARGVHADAHLWDRMPADPDAERIMQFYEETRWAEPEVVTFEEPVKLKKGQWIEWSCDYENDSERSVAQGTATTDEMCMFIGLYYPKNLDMQQCANPDIGRPQLNGVNLADGPLDGADFIECLESSPRVFGGNGPDPDRYDTLSCFTQTCAAVSPLTQPYLQCLAEDPTMCAALKEELEGAGCE